MRQTLYNEAPMTTLHERIETALPLKDAFDFIADFSNAAHWDPGVATSVPAGRGPLGGHPVSPGRSDGAAGSRRWTTSSRPGSRRTAWSSADGLAASSRSTTSGSRRRRRRHADRLHGGHPAARPAPPGCARSPAARSPGSPGTRATECSVRSTAPRGGGLTRHGHRDRRVRGQRPDCRLGPPPTTTGSTVFEGEQSPEATSGQ